MAGACEADSRSARLLLPLTRSTLRAATTRPGVRLRQPRTVQTARYRPHSGNHTPHTHCLPASLRRAPRRPAQFGSTKHLKQPRHQPTPLFFLIIKPLPFRSVSCQHVSGSTTKREICKQTSKRSRSLLEGRAHHSQRNRENRVNCKVSCAICSHYKTKEKVALDVANFYEDILFLILTSFFFSFRRYAT